MQEQAMEDKKGEWFVVHTMSGQENKVTNTIERMINLEGPECGVYEIFVPTEKVSEVRQGKKITTTRKFFPGYVLVRLDLYASDRSTIKEDVWYKIQDTQGIIGFVGSGKRPLPLSEDEVDAMMAEFNVSDETVKPKINFDVGDTVRIKDGAFANFEGKIQEIDSERGKLKLMVSIFGRSTPVELEFWQVEREV